MMTRKVIGIDASRALRAQRTGTERYALEIIRHLLALPAASAYDWRLYVDGPLPSPHFFSLGPESAADSVQVAVELVHLPRQRLWTHRALHTEIKQVTPDLLFVPAHVLPFSCSSAWSLLRQKWGKRKAAERENRMATVVTIHDLGYHWFPAAHTWTQRFYLPLSTRWNAAVASHVITPSAFTAQDLHNRYGTPMQKICVIHEAAAAPVTEVAAPPTVENGAWQRDKLPSIYALYVGTLQPRKNLQRLLQAYAKLVHTGQIKWHLLLAGAPGWQPEDLAGLAATLSVRDQVHLLGYVSDEQLVTLYGGARFFAFPSLFEGFGLPVLEAQSYGVPVMTANNSSLPEIAGDAALLVDPTDVDAIADAMLRLSEDEALRQTLIERGYANTKRFSWEKAARETLAVFEKVLGRGE